MAKQVRTNDAQAPHAAVVAAHNSLLLVLGASSVHFDGPDTDPSGVALYPSGGAPTTLAQVCAFLNAAQGWWNSNHLPYAGGGFAHLAADSGNAIASPAMLTGAQYTELIRAALATSAGQLTTSYVRHISNTGATPHTSPDTVNTLGSTAAVSSLSEITDRLNALKGVDNLHIVKLDGVHGMSGVADAIGAPNASDADLDSLVVLENAVRTKLTAHLGRGADIHLGGADAANVPAGSAVTYPAGLFTMMVEWQSKFGAHTKSGTYHAVADTLELTSPAPTTIASLITAAAELYTKLLAHLLKSPGAGAAQALRLVAP